MNSAAGQQSEAGREGESLEDMIRRHVRVLPDFPRPGVLFQDITPVLGDPACFRRVLDGLLAGIAPGDSAGDSLPVDVIAAIDARGFILGGALAHRLGTGFVPLRKGGKLPWRVLRQKYQLEYGSETLEMHADAIAKGARVLLTDDLLATGGTLTAALKLLAEAGGRLAGVRVIVELSRLGGRARLEEMCRALWCEAQEPPNILSLYRVGDETAQQRASDEGRK